MLRYRSRSLPPEFEKRRRERERKLETQEKEWDEVIIPFAPKKRLPANRSHTANEIHLMLENPGELLIDELLLYERGE